MLMSELGDLLRSAREERGVSQRALARRSGIGQPAISRIERGGESPSFERFAHLLSCLGLRPRVEIEPLPHDAGPELLRESAALSPSERLAAALDDADTARRLRQAGLAGDGR